MKISVQAKPGAKIERVEEVDRAHFIVAVKEPPQEGRANEAICRAIAERFGVPRAQVKILGGHASRQKIIEIETP